MSDFLYYEAGALKFLYDGDTLYIRVAGLNRQFGQRRKPTTVAKVGREARRNVRRRELRAKARAARTA